MIRAGRLTKLREGATQIAGKDAGKKVYCSKHAINDYNALYAMANSGNHWAVQVVKGIIGLTSGHMHQENIYSRPDSKGKFGKDEDLYIVLPGITAIMVKSSGGRGYILNKLTMDGKYAEMQQQATKPGLWRVSKDSEEKPKFLAEGTITHKTSRVVAISGMTSADLRKRVIPDIRKRLLKADITRVDVASEGFDLHITPGKGRIRGLSKVKDALRSNTGQEIVQSATLLANTMYQARNRNKVIWASDFGGSGVLTRALEILAIEKGQEAKLTIKNNHTVFFNRPTTRTLEATKAAEALGLIHIDKASGTNIKEIWGHYLTTESLGEKAYGAISGTAGAAGAVLAVAGLISSAPIIAALAAPVGVVGTALYYVNKARKAKKSLVEDRHGY